MQVPFQLDPRIRALHRSFFTFGFHMLTSNNKPLQLIKDKFTTWQESLLLFTSFNKAFILLGTRSVLYLYFSPLTPRSQSEQEVTFGFLYLSIHRHTKTLEEVQLYLLVTIRNTLSLPCEIKFRLQKAWHQNYLSPL